MANQEHVDLLKQGVETWNQWRKKRPGARPDFSGATLNWLSSSNVNLHDAILTEAKLLGARLIGANLHNANLSKADLTGANLQRADLSGAILQEAKLSMANFRNADLSKIDLSKSNLTSADLAGAILTGADLKEALLRGADLAGADLTEAVVWLTTFDGMDLRMVKGLDTVRHQGPSTLGIDIIYRSQGKIPEAFLRGTGIPDSFITYMRSLVSQPIDFYSCFISYSSKDQAFAERLHADLQSKGVRCWFAPENLKIGDRIRPRIDESIRLYDKLLLVLSERSVASQWVEQEVETALEKERKENRIVLFPIRLDNAVMGVEGGWPALIRNTRHIGDFTRWKQHDDYQKAFDRLLRDLKAES